MSLGQLRQGVWLLFLVGLPLASFPLHNNLDLWQAHAYWAQGGILLSVVLWLWGGGKVRANRPLAAWVAWTGFWVWLTWLRSMTAAKTFPTPLLVPLTHLLLLWLAYLATESWTTDFLRTLMTAMAGMGVVLVAYGFLQAGNLDQFLTNFETVTKRDVIVGTIGNPSLFSTYLSLLVPLFLWKRWWIPAGATVLLLVLLACWYAAVAGLLAFSLVWLWWTWHEHRRTFWVSLSLSLLGGIGLLLTQHQHLTSRLLNGRWEAWSAYWPVIKEHGITGAGIGFVMALSQNIASGPLFQWRHAHNEYLQVWLEQGLIGLAIIGWLLLDLGRRAWRMSHTDTWLALTGILIAFLFNSLISFPAHLWMTGSFGFLAYCGLLTLEDAHGAANA